MLKFFKILKNILKKELDLKNNSKEWRKINSHNDTYCKEKFPFEIVSVGKKTYGPINVRYWGSKNEKLEIGNYVSIAENVKFVLGGNHNTDTITTYPLNNKVLNGESEATTKGKIVVKDDVWIGMDALILSGVTIGQGAVIAAGSVVTKSVEPYCIVGGNPAKVIKKRFSEEIITEMLELDFSKLDLKKVNLENINQFYKQIEKDNIEAMKKTFFTKK